MFRSFAVPSCLLLALAGCSTALSGVPACTVPHSQSASLDAAAGAGPCITPVVDRQGETEEDGVVRWRLVGSDESGDQSGYGGDSDSGSTAGSSGGDSGSSAGGDDGASSGDDSSGGSSGGGSGGSAGGGSSGGGSSSGGDDDDEDDGEDDDGEDDDEGDDD